MLLRPTPSIARSVILGAVLGLFPAPARAQETPAPAVVLAPQPVAIPSIGLTLLLPEGATYETVRTPGGDSGLAAVSPDRTWRLTVSSPTSRNTQLTPAGVAAGLIRELEAARAAVRGKGQQRQMVGTATGIFDRDDSLTLAGLPAARFFSALPDSLEGATVVNGYTIFQIGPGRFAIIQLDVLEENYAAARPVYDAVLESVEFRDPTDLAAERGAGIKAGHAFLASLTPEALTAAAEPGGKPFETWYRIYRPAPTGNRADAEEVAYQRVVTSIGRRGEVDSDKDPRRFNAAENERGLLVRVISRVITPDGPLDSDSAFFQTLDREQEVWSIRMRMKDPKSAIGATEIGARMGDEIKVQIEQPGQAPVTKQWTRPEEAYLCQAERYVLPRLLAGFGAPVVMNFYCYQSKDAEISLRRDILEPGEAIDSSSPRAVAWTLRSRLDENSRDDVAMLTRNGEVLRRVTADEVVWEPIEAKELQALWKRKGLE